MSRRPPPGPSAGVAYVETLVVFPILLLMITGIGQLTALWMGKLAVKHAAASAARAAVVILDDDPRLYGGEERNAAPDGSVRLAEIQRAAAGALVGAGAEDLANNNGVTWEGALRRPDTDLPDLLTPSILLASTVSVSFPGAMDGRVGLRELVTVRVQHGFSCLVPIARWVVCGADSKLPLTQEASLPNQGAPYEYLGPVEGTSYGAGALAAQATTEGP